MSCPACGAELTDPTVPCPSCRAPAVETGSSQGGLPPPQWPTESVTAPPPDLAPIGSSAPPPGADSAGWAPPGPPRPPSAPQGSGGVPKWLLVTLGIGFLVVVGLAAIVAVAVQYGEVEAGSSEGGGQGSAFDDGPPASPPGTDPGMDALWLACGQEDWQACDDLFFESDRGSTYEEFGRTCGYRDETAGFCTSQFGDDTDTATESTGLPASGPDTPPPGTDAELDELWEACAAEDWQACDDLYFQSGLGTDYEAFGDTCGHRVEDAILCAQGMVDEQGTGDDGADGTDTSAAAPATDEALDVLWYGCQDGDWAVCDQLYFESEANSDYEFYGATCGARDLFDGSSQLCQNLHAEDGVEPVVLITELVMGTCFDDPGEVETVYWLQTTTCEGAHDFEVMADIVLEPGPYPDDVETLAAEQCVDVFSDFIGMDYEVSQLEVFHFFPTPESWSQGDRGVNCAVYDPAGPVEGTLAGSAR